MNRNVYSVAGESSYMRILLRGICISFMITIPTFAVTAFLLTYTDFPSKYIGVLAAVVAIISVLLGAFAATRGIKRSGLISGAMIGFVYVLLAYVIGIVFFQQYHISWWGVRMFLLEGLVGAIGGMIGINKKKQKKEGAKSGFFNSLNRRFDD